MTKQEQIEEMVSIMTASNNPFVDVPMEIMPKVAEALYNAGYRKLPEDSVVLSKEEYEVLKIKEKEKHWFETCMSVWKNAKIDSSKETADKIFNDIIQALEERKDSVKEFYGVAESVGADVAIRAVKNLAKQFGIEIKE